MSRQSWPSSGDIWANSAESGPEVGARIRPIVMVEVGPEWANIWPSLVELDRVRPEFGQNWPAVVQIRTFLVMDQIWPNIDQSWLMLTEFGRGCAEFDQNWTHLDQIWSCGVLDIHDGRARALGPSPGMLKGHVARILARIGAIYIARRDGVDSRHPKAPELLRGSDL